MIPVSPAVRAAGEIGFGTSDAGEGVLLRLPCEDDG